MVLAASAQQRGGVSFISVLGLQATIVRSSPLLQCPLTPFCRSNELLQLPTSAGKIAPLMDPCLAGKLGGHPTTATEACVLIMLGGGSHGRCNIYAAAVEAMEGADKMLW